MKLIEDIMKVSVSSFIALAFAGALVYGFITGKVPVETFIPLSSIALGWAFKSAVDKNRS